MRSVLLLLASAGCSQILGLDPPQGGRQDAANTPNDAPLDGRGADARPDGSAGIFTKTFQKGAGTYNGTLDTYIESGLPDSTNNTDPQLRWKQGGRYALLQFPQIFGPFAFAVPTQSTIVSAQLEIYMNSLNCMGELHAVLVSWTDTVTYNSFGPAPGVDSTDYATPIISPTPTMTGLATMNVTSSVQVWSNDQTTNHGWLFLGTAGSDCIAKSSEDGVIANRPKLTIMYQ